MEERSSTVNFAPAAAAGPSSAPATAGGADRRVSLTNRLSRGDTITIAGKTMTVKEKITFRLRVRLLLSSMNAELSMLAVVLVYCAFVFVELALDDQNIRTLIDTETRRVLKDVFLWADFVFLIFFMVELAVKLYAFGLSYLRDLFNGIDALIVVVSFALALVAVELDLGASSDQLMRAMPVLRVVKVVRLLRVVLMMTRLQRSRERYRRMKMIGIGAPVERVLQVAAAATTTSTSSTTTTRSPPPPSPPPLTHLLPRAPADPRVQGEADDERGGRLEPRVDYGADRARAAVHRALRREVGGVVAHDDGDDGLDALQPAGMGPPPPPPLPPASHRPPPTSRCRSEAPTRTGGRASRRSNPPGGRPPGGRPTPKGAARTEASGTPC